MKLTHVDKDGKAKMVDVGNKPDTERQATARGYVKMSREAYDLVRKGHGPKGDVFAVAKIAGIMGAKKTAELVPLCHPLTINFVDVVYDFADSKQTIGITSTVKTKGPTGVEMEAITAVMITALTIYDMCKAIDKAVELGPFYLMEKSGGKSGTYKRQGHGAGVTGGRMKGKIISVNISADKGEKKHNIDKCLLKEGHGLTEDAHAGAWHRQVSLLAAESIQKIKDKGLDVHAGDFAENITTEGIELFTLPVGTQLKVGDGIIMKVTQIGKECHARCNIFYQVGDCVMPREGIFTEVLTGGEIKVGDEIEVIQ